MVLEQLASQALPVCLDPLELLEVMVNLVSSVLRVQSAVRETADLRASPVRPAVLEVQVNRVPRERLDLLERRDQPDNPDFKDHKVRFCRHD